MPEKNIENYIENIRSKSFKKKGKVPQGIIQFQEISLVLGKDKDIKDNQAKKSVG